MQVWVVFVVAAAAVGLVDWWAVGSRRRAVELWAKPSTMAVLVAVAATAGDPSTGTRWLLVTGAALGLLGDIALMFETESAFMAGLGSFALGHLAYAAAAVATGFAAGWAAIGLVCMAALLAFRFVTQIVAGALRDGGAVLAAAVTFYACVITVMVVTAWGTSAWLAGVGAMAFAASDWVLGHQRFAGPLPGGRLAVMVPYHVGQALLLIGLARA